MNEIVVGDEYASGMRKLLEAQDAIVRNKKLDKDLEKDTLISNQFQEAVVALSELGVLSSVKFPKGKFDKFHKEHIRKYISKVIGGIWTIMYLKGYDLPDEEDFVNYRDDTFTSARMDTILLVLEAMTSLHGISQDLFSEEDEIRCSLEISEEAYLDILSLITALMYLANRFGISVEDILGNY